MKKISTQIFISLLLISCNKINKKEEQHTIVSLDTIISQNDEVVVESDTYYDFDLESEEGLEEIDNHNQVIHENYTPYEKATFEIMIKYAKEMGMSEKELRDDISAGNWFEANNKFVKKFESLPKYMIISIGQNIKEDMSSDKVLNLRIEEDFKDIAESDLKKSDYFKISRIIKEKHEKWRVKKEFEKTEEYQNRLLNEDEFIQNELFKAINNTVNEYTTTHDYNIKSTPLDYDADKEILNYHFSLNNNTVVWKGYVKVNADKARRLKNNDGKIITSLRSKNSKQKLQFAYYNIVPSNLEFISLHPYGKEEGGLFPIIITHKPYGLTNGSDLFSKEKLDISSDSYSGYSLDKYIDTALSTKNSIQNWVNY